MDGIPPPVTLSRNANEDILLLLVVFMSDLSVLNPLSNSSSQTGIYTLWNRPFSFPIRRETGLSSHYRAFSDRVEAYLTH